MARAARDENWKIGDPRPDESGARPLWKSHDTLEGAAPPLSASERADVDALLRDLGTSENPNLRPPVLPREPEPRRPRTRFYDVPAFTLTLLGAAAFLVGMVATIAVMEWRADEVRDQRQALAPSALIDGKRLADLKPVVMLQLAPFIIDVDSSAWTQPSDAEAATTAAAWRPPLSSPVEQASALGPVEAERSRGAVMQMPPMTILGRVPAPAVASDEEGRSFAATIEELTAPAAHRIPSADRHAAVTPLW